MTFLLLGVLPTSSYVVAPSFPHSSFDSFSPIASSSVRSFRVDARLRSLLPILRQTIDAGADVCRDKRYVRTPSIFIFSDVGLLRRRRHSFLSLAVISPKFPCLLQVVCFLSPPGLDRWRVYKYETVHVRLWACICTYRDCYGLMVSEVSCVLVVGARIGCRLGFGPRT